MANGTWVKVAQAAEIEPGGMKGIEIGSRHIALYNVDGSIYATNNICTHAHAFLTEGYLEDNLIECPLHAGQFDVITGQAMGPPVTCNIETYSVRVSGEYLEVLID